MLRAKPSLSLCLPVLLVGCDLLTPGAPAESDVLDGTIEGMTGSQVAQHLAGDEEFARAAIRQAGAKHEGLLEWADEAKVRPHNNAWSGLRTPQWVRRRVELKV